MMVIPTIFHAAREVLIGRFAADFAARDVVIFRRAP
jgi:hypothetical protein